MHTYYMSNLHIRRYYFKYSEIVGAYAASCRRITGAVDGERPFSDSRSGESTEISGIYESTRQMPPAIMRMNHYRGDVPLVSLNATPTEVVFFDRRPVGRYRVTVLSPPGAESFHTRSFCFSAFAFSLLRGFFEVRPPFDVAEHALFL